MIIVLVLILLGVLGFFCLLLAESRDSEISKLDRPQDLHKALHQPIEKLLDSELPEYKFFHIIINELFKMKKTYGAEVRSALNELKQAIQKDQKFSRKIKKVKQNSILQICSIISITLLFIAIASLFILNIPIDLGFCVIFVLWNLFGFFLFLYLCDKTYKKIFANFDKFFCSLYLVQSLFSISRPINEVITKSKIHDLDKFVNLCAISEKAIVEIRQIKMTGKFDQFSWNLIISDLWDSYEDKMEDYQKRVTVYRSLLLMLFCLPSYLYSVIHLMESLFIS